MGPEMQVFLHLIFMECICTFPTYRGVFSNGGRMEMVHCVPLLLFLEGVPMLAGSIGSVFWDCNWGCQGVSGEEKETKIKGSRRREEKAGIS